MRDYITDLPVCGLNFPHEGYVRSKQLCHHRLTIFRLQQAHPSETKQQRYKVGFMPSAVVYPSFVAKAV